MFYDISVDLPIISMLLIVFLALMNVNILIHLENNYKNFKKLNTIKEKFIVFICILFKVVLFIFFFVNMIILYTKL